MTPQREIAHMRQAATPRQAAKVVSQANGSTNGINLMLVQTDGKKNTPNNINNVEPQQGSGHTPCHFDLLTVAKKKNKTTGLCHALPVIT